jgi:uncharacterized protein (TIGR01777 family)
MVETMRSTGANPHRLVCASAIGFYGERGDDELTEESSRGSGLLADLCAAWEHEALQARAFGVRVVCARMGIVLAKDGGALARMLTPFKLGVGGPLGSGQQWMSVIHIDDAVGLLLHAAERSEVEGPLNVCCPEPARNIDFTRALGRALHRPAVVRAPTFALRLAFGEMADAVVASQRVIPQKAISTGYGFRYGTAEEALGDLVG